MAIDLNQQEETSPFADLLKLSPTQRDNLAKLAADTAPDPAAVADQRKHPRIPIDKFKKGFVEFKGAQGGTSKFIIFPTGISQGGLSFLHGAFVHSDTKCTISVPMPDGEILAIDASVRWCRLLRGRAHEVGAKFTTMLSKDVIDSYNTPPSAETPTIQVPTTPPLAHSEAAPIVTPAAILPPVVLKRIFALTSALDDASSIGEAIKVIVKDLFKKDSETAQNGVKKSGS